MIRENIIQLGCEDDPVPQYQGSYGRSFLAVTLPGLVMIAIVLNYKF